jgi:hypothetical protein
VAGVEWVTLTGRLTRADDQPATGYVQVRMLETERVTDVSGVIITQQPERIELVAGEFATLVPVTDDITAPRWIVVDLLLVDTAPEQMVFTVDGSTDPVNLADVQPVPIVPDSDGHTVGIPWDLIGRPNGVAPLDLARKVPAMFLPDSVTAGMISWFEGDGPPPAAIPGAAPADMYYDRLNNRFYQLR